MIPKEHHESSSTIPEATAGRMFHIGRGSASPAAGAGLRRFQPASGRWDGRGQVVPHAHLHVVPRGVEDGFHWNWRQLNYQEGQAAEIAAKVAKRLGSALEK